MDRELLLHVAKIARLELTDSEAKEFLPQLNEIMAAFEELAKVDTNGVEASCQPIPLGDALREDTEKKPLDNETALANTSHKTQGYFKGPRVI